MIRHQKTCKTVENGIGDEKFCNSAKLQVSLLNS